MVDLAEVLEMERQEERKHVMVLRSGETQVGFVVDYVESVRRFPVSQVSAPSPYLHSLKHLKGVIQWESRTVMVTDLVPLVRRLVPCPDDQLAS